jgi:hypothetical protein
MSVDEFRKSTAEAQPPALSGALRALWHDARGDWDAAHDWAQRDEGAAGAWVHAYLHRREGDPANAAYWYRRAGRPVAKDGFEAEWERISAELLAAE